MAKKDLDKLRDLAQSIGWTEGTPNIEPHQLRLMWEALTAAEKMAHRRLFLLAPDWHPPGPAAGP